MINKTGWVEAMGQQMAYQYSSELLLNSQSRGLLVMDAHLAALAIERGATV